MLQAAAKRLIFSPFQGSRSLSLMVDRRENRRTFEEAVISLNRLQTNAAHKRKAAAERGISYGEYNIVLTTSCLKLLGVEVAQLDSLNPIHVTGSKGKGSTCAFVESILRQHGMKTGFFSSPHLVHVTERIRLNGVPISKEKFAKNFWFIHDCLTQNKEPGTDLPPYFTFLTVMAYYTFLMEKVDVAVVEVGIGGLGDSTNVLRNPVVCGVSTIDLDHQAILGDTEVEIAWNKSGIFKPNSIAVTVKQEDDVAEVLAARGNEFKCLVYEAPGFEQFKWPSNELKFGIPGDCQRINIPLALCLSHLWLNRRQNRDFLPSTQPEALQLPVLKPFPLTQEFINGLNLCQWPGRSQTIRRTAITYYLDGAHTPKSIKCCADWFKEESGIELKSLSCPVYKILVFNCGKDRSPAILLSGLKDLCFDTVVSCPNLIDSKINVASEQAYLLVSVNAQINTCLDIVSSWTQLQNSCDKNHSFTCCQQTATFPCIKSTVEFIESLSKKGRTANGDAFDHVQVLVTGSLHLVGDMLAVLENE